MKDEEKGAIPSEEKEVEELARAMCSFSKNTLCRECSDACFYNDYAKRAIDKGWRKQSEWISVDERLPENDKERVLVMLKDTPFVAHIGTPKIDTDRYMDRKWVRWHRYITHWMPLPEAPKMKGGAE